MKSLLTILCTSVLLAGSAYAASDTTCQVIGEEIIPLRVPNFDNPILWKRTLGGPGPDMPTDLIALADGGFVLVGETAHYDKDKGLGERQLYMARLDINGKVVWEKRNQIKGFSQAAAGIAVKDRLAVLSGIEATEKFKTVQLDLFDGLGAVKSTKVFTDSVYNLTPEGIVADSKTQALTIALWASNRKDPTDNFTILKKISFDGKDISSRQYLPGVPNHLESFKKLSNGDLIGSGQIQENKVAAGWIFSVDGDSGDLKFQRPYARGYQSNLKGVAEDGQGNYVVIGDSVPTDEGLRAAWVMKVDGNGSPLWQKYIQGKYAFSGKDIAVLKDGRILALVNARPNTTDGGRDHVRLMTFTPQGKLEGDEALIEGANAQGVDLLIRDQSRILTGVTQSGLADYALAKNQKAAGWDFWILGLPKLSEFKDPCSARKINDAFDEGY